MDRWGLGLREKLHNVRDHLFAIAHLLTTNSTRAIERILNSEPLHGGASLVFYYCKHESCVQQIMASLLSRICTEATDISEILSLRYKEEDRIAFACGLIDYRDSLDLFFS